MSDDAVSDWHLINPIYHAFGLLFSKSLHQTEKWLIRASICLGKEFQSQQQKMYIC